MFGPPRFPDQLPLPIRQFMKPYPRNIGLFPPPFISQLPILPMKMGGIVKRRKRKAKK